MAKWILNWQNLHWSCYPRSQTSFLRRKAILMWKHFLYCRAPDYYFVLSVLFVYLAFKPVCHLLQIRTHNQMLPEINILLFVSFPRKQGIYVFSYLSHFFLLLLVLRLRLAWQCTSQWHGETSPKYLSCVTQSSKDITHTHIYTHTHILFNSASSVPIHANTGTQHDSVYAVIQTSTHKSLILLIWSNRSLAFSSVFRWALASYLELTLNLNIDSFMHSAVLKVAVFSGKKVQPPWDIFDSKQIMQFTFFPALINSALA